MTPEQIFKSEQKRLNKIARDAKVAKKQVKKAQVEANKVKKAADRLRIDAKKVLALQKKHEKEEKKTAKALSKLSQQKKTPAVKKTLAMVFPSGRTAKGSIVVIPQVKKTLPRQILTKEQKIILEQIRAIYRFKPK